LNDLEREVGNIPHVIRENNGSLRICTARHEDVATGRVQTTAVTSIGWAVKWIWMVEGWLNEELGEEVFFYFTF
jgi:hypothetical protein